MKLQENDKNKIVKRTDQIARKQQKHNPLRITYIIVFCDTNTRPNAITRQICEFC